MQEKWKDRLAAFGTLLAFLVGGFTIGNRIESARTEFWKDQAGKFEKDLNKTEENLEESKRREASLDKELFAAQKAAPLPATEGALKKITVARGGTGEVMGELLISVPSITPAYEPFRYVVSVKTSGPGSQASLSKELNIGDGFDFGSYRIRLLNADLAKAQFGLQKL